MISVFGLIDWGFILGFENDIDVIEWSFRSRLGCWSNKVFESFYFKMFDLSAIICAWVLLNLTQIVRFLFGDEEN